MILKDDCENRRSLGELGLYDTLDRAESTFRIALDALIAEGGGVLCIPREGLPAGFYPRSPKQMVLALAATVARAQEAKAAGRADAATEPPQAGMPSQS